MSDCVRWDGSIQGGYGRVWKGRTSQQAHRYVWEQTHGTIPADHVLHHECGVKACVNLDHLRLMTVQAHSLLHQAHQPRSFLGQSRREPEPHFMATCPRCSDYCSGALCPSCGCLVYLTAGAIRASIPPVSIDPPIADTRQSHTKGT